MNPIISSQQAYFFNHNGYIELEELFSSVECDELKAHIHEALFTKLKKTPSRVSAAELYTNGRDLWRHQQTLKTLLVSKRMTSIPFGLTNKPSLHLACDQWVAPITWAKAEKAKDLFSIQGLALICFIRLTPPSESEVSTVTFEMEPGIIPLPTKKGSLLAMSPNLLLNLPRLALTNADLYAVAYALPSAVYYHNPKDPANNQLKQLGYNFGDRLIHAHHPLIQYKPI